MDNHSRRNQLVVYCCGIPTLSPLPSLKTHGYASCKMQDRKSIQVIWEPVTDPSAEEAIRDVFALVLREMDHQVVDNPG